MYIFKYILVFTILIQCLEVTSFAQSCDCDVTDNKEKSYDLLLQLSSEEIEDATSYHFPWGVPIQPSFANNEVLLYQDDYITKYDKDLLIPLWVGYKLTKDDLDSDYPRTECFRRDIRIIDDSFASNCDDYDEPEFDRGHMVPNADMERSESAMINTYVFTNIAPQHDRFNRVIWQRLERYVRIWAKDKGNLYIITGSILDQDNDGKRDNDSDATTMDTGRVSVPTHYYKILMHEKANSFIETLTILLPHVDETPTGRRDSDQYLEENITSIDKIEELTGIDFLNDLEEYKEVAVENFKADRLWPLR